MNEAVRVLSGADESAGDARLIVSDLTARAVNVPMPRPVRTASGSILAAPLVLIDLSTEEGVQGRAYLFGYTAVTLRPLVQLLGELKPLLVGKPVAPVERAFEFTRTFRLLGRQGLLGMSLSGIDMALWDALGRARNCTVCELLGGEAKPVVAYDSYGTVDPLDDAGALERSLEQGFTAIKIKIGSGDLRSDVDNVAAVRRIVGPRTRLLVDYNQSLSVPEAIRRTERLAEFDIEWVEEPVPAEDLAGHARVRAAGHIAVQTGENWWFPEDTARAIAAGASDFAMLDIMKIGGVTGWLRAAGQAEGASLPVSSHLFVEASAHLLPVTATAHYLEYLDVASPVLLDPLPVVDGKVQARGPGLGLDWDEMAVDKYAF